MAVVAIGVWGGPDIEHFSDSPVGPPGGPRRLFSRRSEARWRSLLTTVGCINDFEAWVGEGAADDAFHYHLALVTAHP